MDLRNNSENVALNSEDLELLNQIEFALKKVSEFTE